MKHGGIESEIISIGFTHIRQQICDRDTKYAWSLPGPQRPFSSSVVHLSTLRTGFWKFKQCTQRTIFFQWMKCSEFFQRRAKALWFVEPWFSVPPVLGWRFKTEQFSKFTLAACTATSCGTAHQPSTRPWWAPQWTWPWAGFAAQPKLT